MQHHSLHIENTQYLITLGLKIYTKNHTIVSNDHSRVRHSK